MDREGREGAQRLATAVLLAAGLGLAVISVFLEARRGHGPPQPAQLQILFHAGGLGYLAIAGWVSARRPANAMGPLLATAGVLWFATSFGLANNPVLFTAGLVLGAGALPVVMHIGLAMPSGRLETTSERATALGGYVTVYGFQIASFMMIDNCAFPVPVPNCPGNLATVVHDPLLAEAVDEVFSLVLVGFMVVIAALAAGRWQRVPRSTRPALAVVTAAVLLQLWDVSGALLTLLPEGPYADEFWWLTLESALLSFPILPAMAYWMVALELRTTRRQVTAAGDEARRRVERDLHDGAQQQLLGLAIELEHAALALDDDADPDVRKRLDHVARGIDDAVDGLRALARGAHPGLDAGGLAAALEAIAETAPVPVELGRVPARRFPPELERAVCFLVGEAIANTARHAAATHVTVDVSDGDGTLNVEVRDDGIGGAAAGLGTGLHGLDERFRALDGSLAVDSPAGRGTRLVGHLPVEPAVPG